MLCLALSSRCLLPLQLRLQRRQLHLHAAAQGADKGMLVVLDEARWWER